MRIELSDIVGMAEIGFQPVKFTKRFTEQNFDRTWEAMLNELREKLKRRWREAEFVEGEQADFALSDDRNNAWVQCGGIYTSDALCGDFVGAVAEVINQSAQAELWSVHFVIELGMGEDPSMPNGEIIILRDTIHVPNYGEFDYKPLIRSIKRTFKLKG